MSPQDSKYYQHMPSRISVLAFAATVFFSGCGLRAENVTAKFEGRRVGAYEADGQWIAYVWSPAQLVSTQGHLVLRDQFSSMETELESDLNGPMALCDGRVVWWNGRLRDDEGKADIIAHDIDTGGRSAIAHEKVLALDADGDQVAWEQAAENFGSEIHLYDFETGQARIIGSGGAEGDIVNRGPCVGDGMIAWEMFDRKLKASKLALYDSAADKLSQIDISGDHPRLSLSQHYLVYCLNQQDIHLYDVASQTDRLVAAPERLRGAPFLEGNQIAWCEHIRRQDFKGIPGQPLMDEKDIIDVYVYNIDSGKRRMIARNLMSIGGRVAIHNGRVYLPVYREYPPPGSSNMVVPVDLWIW